MSKDIIYREDAIKAINARSNWYQVTCNGKQIAVMIMAKDVNEILEKVPSADRPQGDSVSRRYLLAEIDDLADEFSEVDENGLHSERWCGILDSKGVIVNAPSVSDRPQGEWIYTMNPLRLNDEWECSKCGYLSFAKANYCGHCGCRMKGADDE